MSEKRRQDWGLDQMINEYIVYYCRITTLLCRQRDDDDDDYDDG